MTDPVDELLRADGQRWRAAQPEPPEPDVRRWRTGKRQFHLAAAAAAVVVISVGAVVMWPKNEQATPAHRVEDLSAVAIPTITWVPGRTLELALTGEGATVQATGTVRESAGQRLLCPPAPTIGEGCPMGVRFTGVDVAVGTEVTLKGTWSGGALHDAKLDTPIPRRGELKELPMECVPPPGGWQPGNADTNALHEYVYAHPERFHPPKVDYPNGPLVTPTGDAGTRPPEVLVVGVVTGDARAELRELRARYTGNLCVMSTPGWSTVVDYTKAEAESRSPALTGLMRDPANGIFSISSTSEVVVDVVQLTADLNSKINAASPGPVYVRTWLVAA
ncbi:hypothetical protein JOD54_002830 [Actinokineospora baliensis]|uniref:hypothetical protein n=1 Tax=Actinokineospora baliensis TaxID=547056 RepID=UPI0019574650|nr:hypothetical protein [Actinokineospora baliensis]MBM7772626.1 hypothetical protein [Actinokineospora baliensis]